MPIKEHFFESLLAQLPGDFVVLDMEFKYVYVNPKAVRDPKIREWIIGKTDLEYCAYRNVPKEIAQKRRAMLTKVLETKSEVEIEESLKDKEGNLRYYIRRVKPYIDSEGNFTHFLGYGVDITEQKEIRSDLERNRNFIQQILDASPQLIFIKDAEGNIIQANKALVDLIKMDISDLPTKEVSDVYKNESEYNEHVVADKKVIEEGLMVRVEEKFTTADGEVLFFDSIKIPFPSLDNKVNVLCISTDITLQKKSREALIDNQKLLFDAERLTKAGSYQFDFLKNEIQWSPGLFLIVKRPQEECSPTYEEFLNYVHPDDVDSLNKNMSRIIADKLPHDIIYRIVCSDGEVKHVQTNSQLKFDSSGNLVGLFGSLIDITEQKKFEEELKKAKQIAEESVSVKEKFMANLGHEMRTPLNGVLGMSRLLQKTQLSQTQKKYINVLNSTAENLLVIINDLLDIAKIESGTLSFDKVTFDINQVADTAVQIKLLVAEEKGLILKHLIDSTSSVKVIGDPYRINQVLLNLIGNAIKFTDEGEIIVSHKIEKRNDKKVWVKFSVKDTGIGIEEGQYSKIFNSFTQLNPQNQNVSEGIGLGLSIVKSIVEQMGGEIKVESVFGKGSEFSVILPFELSTGEEQEKADTSERLMMTSLRVLLAEDNLVNQFIVQAMLQDWGFNVDVAENGEEAFALFKKNNYEIVLMDIQMPVLDGLATTELIRNYKDEKKSKVPIIALTANPSKQFQKKFISVGMNDVIVKPFKDDLLYKKIVTLCSGNVDLIKVVKRKYPARKKPEAESSKLYNLSFLEKEIGPNSEFMQRMLEIFIETIPDAVNRMNGYFVSGDMDAVATLAHKIKPTIDSAGITSLYQTIRDVEKYRESKRTSTQLKNDLIKIETTINAVVYDFKIEIESIKNNNVNLN
ncbi:MAG: PAS domain S-box protein [Bacteroidota bacterium]